MHKFLKINAGNSLSVRMYRCCKLTPVWYRSTNVKSIFHHGMDVEMLNTKAWYGWTHVRIKKYIPTLYGCW